MYSFSDMTVLEFHHHLENVIKNTKNPDDLVKMKLVDHLPKLNTIIRSHDLRPTYWYWVRSIATGKVEIMPCMESVDHVSGMKYKYLGTIRIWAHAENDQFTGRYEAIEFSLGDRNPFGD